jgi:hypothetical protein
MSRLNGILADELEIVGFNGTPQQVECGRSLPVARRKSDGKHCVLSSVENSAMLSWHDGEEADAFAKERRWTRLLAPLSLPRSCFSESEGRLARQPMVVFAAQSFLDVAGAFAWPPTFRGEAFFWHRLEQDENLIQAACGSAEAVEALLDDWASRMKQRFDAMRRQNHDPASLKRVADFMLCAAKDRSLRWQAYLRYAMVQEPERVRRTFDTFTRHEFPAVPWQTYLDEIRDLSEVLQSLAAEQPHPVAISSALNALSHVRGIATRQPIDVCQPKKVA